jgi:flagellar basal body-associated protein FliL
MKMNGLDPKSKATQSAFVVVVVLVVVLVVVVVASFTCLFLTGCGGGWERVTSAIDRPRGCHGRCTIACQ